MLLRLAIACLLLCPSSLWAQSSSPYGINVHAPEREHLRFLFDKVQEAGIGWVRIDFIWAQVEPEPGVARWQIYDDIVAVARSRGLRVLALIGYIPAWATDGPELSGVPRQVSDWADFCYRAAQRYREDIQHWEIWNEPNLRSFWVGSRLEYIERILEPGARAIRAANPDAQVGGPALSHVVAKGRDWHSWLRDILHEAGDELDFLTHHAYDHSGPEGVTRLLAGQTPHGRDPSRWDVEPPSLAEVLILAEWDRPIWLTETGWVTTRLDERRQSRHYQGFLDQWLTGDPDHRWLDKVFFYELQDDRDPRVRKLGILRVSGREKPAYRVYRDFIEAHPPGQEVDDRDQDGSPPDGPRPEPPAPPGPRDDPRGFPPGVDRGTP
jgi:hypothetical protein